MPSAPNAEFVIDSKTDTFRGYLGMEFDNLCSRILDVKKAFDCSPFYKRALHITYLR